RERNRKNIEDQMDAARRRNGARPMASRDELRRVAGIFGNGMRWPRRSSAGTRGHDGPLKSKAACLTQTPDRPVATSAPESAPPARQRELAMSPMRPRVP